LIDPALLSITTAAPLLPLGGDCVFLGANANDIGTTLDLAIEPVPCPPRESSGSRNRGSRAGASDRDALLQVPPQRFGDFADRGRAAHRLGRQGIGSGQNGQKRLVSSPLRKTSTGGSPICDTSTTPLMIASISVFFVFVVAASLGALERVDGRPRRPCDGYDDRRSPSLPTTSCQ
jgi:hypothetical protein